ncbi:MAG: type III-B CRISPR module-associated protein Cmr3 [Armatimonadota bacterium]
MQFTDLVIMPRDPLLFRDGKPFGPDPGAAARTLTWPLPRTCAGAVRTHIGTSLGWDWSKDGPQKAKEIAFRGPLLVAKKSPDANWQVYLHAPQDAVIFRNEAGEPRAMRLSPWKTPEGAGCDLPVGLLPLRVEKDVKPEGGYVFWSLSETAKWMAEPARTDVPEDVLRGLPQQTRVHVKIRSESGTVDPGYLYSVRFLVFPDGTPLQRWQKAAETPSAAASAGMLCRIAPPDRWACEPSMLTLGGERKLAHVDSAEALSIRWPQMPEELSQAVSSSRRLRLQLATPAIFANGWKPGWLDMNLQGTPPGVQDLRLRLVAAAVGRRQPVSGWDYEKKGPRPPRYTVPAGSVYFFEVLEGSINPDALWLTPLSDEETDRRDGFGLALPGCWDYAE